MATWNGIHIGIIGGSGIYSLEVLHALGECKPLTPWGYPSDKITIFKTSTGTKVAFLPRNGKGHFLNPSEVPSRANIAALKSIGVKVVLAFSAVGSLREEICPTHFIIPSQIVDQTKGIRPDSYFEKGIVGHVGFSDPFHAPLGLLIANHMRHRTDIPFHVDKTLVCIEGPAFSTRAESNMYRALGGDIINMSVIPEAKLAREAEIAYQMVCMSIDYDCWKVDEEPVKLETVMATMEQNKRNMQALLSGLLIELDRVLELGTYQGQDFFESIRHCTKYVIVTAPTHISPEAAERLAYIHPEYFSTFH